MQNVGKILFALSSLAVAVLYWLFERRGNTIRQLKAKVENQRIVDRLRDINEQAKRSEEDYAVALKRYNDLYAKYEPQLRALHASQPNKE